MVKPEDSVCGYQVNELWDNGLPLNKVKNIHAMTYNTVQEWAYTGIAMHPNSKPINTHVW